MEKKRVLIVLWMCLGIAGIVSAVEVISIDINYYDPNAPAYSGEAAVAGAAQWISYYGGWGVAMGSPRSADLISYNAATQAGTYAEQVWIGDTGGHNYIQGSGMGLLDDGFVINPAEPNDPNITLFGWGAYGGTFDVYVYSNVTGDFTIKENAGKTITTKHVDGDVPDGQFVEGGNYVVFPALSIGEPNSVALFYTNQISGIQLVSLKEPVAVESGTVIDARNYDVAYDTNARSGEITLYGPDLGNYVSYLDAGEYMIYDLILTSETKGQYTLSANVVHPYGAVSLPMYLDSRSIGTLTRASTSTAVVATDNTITINLLEGTHQLKWALPGVAYFDIVDFTFTRLGDVVMTNCEEVATYGRNYAGDMTGDCKVDMEDLLLLVENWANCYDPEGC